MYAAPAFDEVQAYPVRLLGILIDAEHQRRLGNDFFHVACGLARGHNGHGGVVRVGHVGHLAFKFFVRDFLHGVCSSTRTATQPSPGQEMDCVAYPSCARWGVGSEVFEMFVS